MFHIHLVQTTLKTTFLPKKFGARRNLSASENLPLKALKQNKDIIIRKADKGTTIVIQNRSDYIAEGLRQLNNGVHYEKIESVYLEKTYIEVRQHVAYMYLQNEINKTTYDYLYDVTNKATVPYIYFLPKIHKIQGILENMDPLKRTQMLLYTCRLDPSYRNAALPRKK